MPFHDFCRRISISNFLDVFMGFQVVAHFTDDGFDNKHGVTHFSVTDEDEAELPPIIQDQAKNGPSRGASLSSQNQPIRGASVSSQNRRNTAQSQHLYEAIE